MNRRFFGKKLAGIAAIGAAPGVAIAADAKPKATASLLPSNFKFPEHGCLVFEANRITEYEIHDGRHGSTPGCKYSVLLDDGSIERRISGIMLAMAWMPNGDSAVIDVAPMGLAS